MDISICKLNMKKKTLEFSGAHNPLVIVSGNELKTVKGDSVATDWSRNCRNKTFY